MFIGKIISSFAVKIAPATAKSAAGSFIFIPPVLVSVIYLVKKIKTKTINKKLSDEQVEIKKEDFELLSNRKFQFKLFI